MGQIAGKFQKNAVDADCHIQQTEPFLQWSNAAESAIRKLKCGAKRKMIKTGSPCRLWDHCLELEAYIQSHTALNNFTLQGETPESYMQPSHDGLNPEAERRGCALLKLPTSH